MSFEQIKKYLQKNLYYVFAFSFFMGLFIYGLVIHLDRKKYFDEGRKSKIEIDFKVVLTQFVNLNIL